MEDAKGPVSGAADPISSEELQQEAEIANVDLQDESPAVGGDTHLPASESAALGQIGQDKARHPDAVATRPPD